MDIQGIIENLKVENGISKKNGKPYTRGVITIQGKDYSTFDKNIYEVFKIGDNVLMHTEKKGEYENMLSMELVEEIAVDKIANPPIISEPGQGFMKVTKTDESEYELRLHRGECVKLALQQQSVMKMTKFDNDLTLEQADRFLAYIYGE